MANPPYYTTNNPTYLAQRERIIEGMGKAGVPEGGAPTPFRLNARDALPHGPSWRINVNG